MSEYDEHRREQAEKHSPFAERCANVAYDDYAGYREVHVRVLRETPKRYLCRFASGLTRLVPKGAVRGMLLPGECLIHDRRTAP